MDFYGQVLQELMVAVGAALLVANVYALSRRKTDRAAIPERTVARGRPGSPVRSVANTSNRDYTVVPVARSVTYALIGFIVMAWGIASLIN